MVQARCQALQLAQGMDAGVDNPRPQLGQLFIPISQLSWVTATLVKQLQ